MNEYAIKVEAVSKSFRVPHERYSSLKQNAIHLFTKRSYTTFDALNDINFEIKRGEFFGIVGRNGSGKSTLLKILAGIYLPSRGKVDLKGSLSPFIELGVGFNPELSARDNVFLNGAILGLTRKQIEIKFDDIIAFAELEDFVDQKLKNFSSGMQVRLAFSIAIQAQTDILLVDEVLAVGDLNFQEKCFDVFRRMKAEGRTIVFVTHDMNSVIEFCDRVAFISESELKFIGSPNEAANLYYRQNNEKTEQQMSAEHQGIDQSPIAGMRVKNSKSEDKRIFKTGESLQLSIDLNLSERTKNLGVAIFREDGLYCYGTNTIIDKVSLKGASVVTLTVPSLPLISGSYFFKIGVFGDKDTDVIFFLDRAMPFRVQSSAAHHGVVDIAHEWSSDVPV